MERLDGVLSGCLFAVLGLVDGVDRFDLGERHVCGHIFFFFPRSSVFYVGYSSELLAMMDQIRSVTLLNGRSCQT